MSRTLQQIGSAWDVGASPDRVGPAHLIEWIEGSAAHPELAAANLQTLTGTDALEALAGDRLDQLGGWSQQLATASVRSLLRPLEPVAEAGGWWCSGLDPLADWASMEWGCFKPDAPRWDQERNRPRKYEHPIKVAARSFWLRVPTVVAQPVAERWGLELPAVVAADATGDRGEFWRWWAQTPSLPLVVTEGAKKAAALLSIGVPAVALPGIWNGAPKNPDTDRPELLADLAGVPLSGRPVWVLFDWSESRDGRRAVRNASQRLGRLLKVAGAVVKVGACPGPHKGADDHLAAGRSWRDLANALKALATPPELPQIRQPDVVAPAGQLLEHSAPIPAPELAPVVAMAAPMGTGKTRSTAVALAPVLASGSARVLNLTHRTSLGLAQSEALGLAWADEAKPGSVHRLQGMGMCVDSACPTSGLKLNPREWRDSIVVLDEWAQVVEHLLFGIGTAVASRRVAVLGTIAQVLSQARQTIASDAQLGSPHLQLLESLTGRRAHLISSAHRPFDGRIFHCPEGLNAKQANQQARALLLTLINGGRRFLFWSTAQKASSKNSPQNLARLHMHYSPKARVLVIDSENPEAAARLAADPNREAAAYDAIYCSPAISSGLSIELAGHFDAVVLLSGGTVAPEHVAQAAARVRDRRCPVFCFAPERSPGNHLRVGSGDFCDQALIHHLGGSERLLVADLIAAGDYDPTTNDPGPWLRCWAQLGASRNRARLAYSATVRGLCEREGWEVIDSPVDADVVSRFGCLSSGSFEAEAQMVSLLLQRISEETQLAEDQAIIDAVFIKPAEAAELAKRRHLNPQERAQLQRFLVSLAWGIGDGPLTRELLAANRDGLNQRLLFRWILQNLEARQLVSQHDLAIRQQLTAYGQAWAPDLVRKSLGHKVTAADAIGLPGWITREDWFTAEDPLLLELDATATIHRSSLVQTLGVSPAKRPTTTLRNLLKLVGCGLAGKRSRGPDGNCWRYMVTLEDLPEAVNQCQLESAWRAQLSGDARGVPKLPL